MQSPTIQDRFHHFIFREYTHVDTYELARQSRECVTEQAYRYNLAQDSDNYSEINGRVYHRGDAESAKEEFLHELTEAGFGDEEIGEAEGIII